MLPKNTLNAHEVYETLVGEIGIERGTALYELKQWEVLAIIRGYRKREVNSLRSVRWQTWALLCAMGAKNMSTPEDLFELPGDGEGGSGEISDDEYKAAMELIRRANETDEAPKSADDGDGRGG